MNDILLFERNFGECQSLHDNPSMFSAFLSALISFSSEFTNSELKSINYEDFKIYFHHDLTNPNLLFILMVDLNDDTNTIQIKVTKIADLFRKKYEGSIQNFDGNVSLFNEFGEFLIDMNIAKKNCGEYPECNVCPNRKKTSKILQAFSKDEEGLFNTLRS